MDSRFLSMMGPARVNAVGRYRRDYRVSNDEHLLVTAAFYTRLMLFVIIAIYGSISVAVFDAFWPKKSAAIIPATPLNEESNA